jgi:hypothetical protein
MVMRSRFISIILVASVLLVSVMTSAMSASMSASLPDKSMTQQSMHHEPMVVNPDSSMCADSPLSCENCTVCCAVLVTVSDLPLLPFERVQITSVAGRILIARIPQVLYRPPRV